MKIYRYVIDGLVILLALFVFGPHLYYLLPYDYVDTTLPDDVADYNIAMYTYLESLPQDFQTLLAEPTGLTGTQRFRTQENRSLLSAEEVYEQSKDSVVIIETMDMYGDPYSGGGVVLSSDGLIVTSYHQLQDAEKVAVSLYDGSIVKVTDVVAYDEALDIAFIKIDSVDLQPMPIGDSALLSIGERVYSIGHPEGFHHSFAEGVVSGIRDYSSRGEGIQIQMTNPISAGNSGGALLNTYGELVGIPSWSLEYEDNIVSIQNLNFSIPIREALGILE
ncbi:MAG: hypothetical protein COV34_01195 [Candidatus Zambryskibacteria bacterium CG10_big_fil_rev_8_21_14_0_10_42_12]|uniref:Uncharacterized protein n=1 Tax=Candidatus Zambryskibacteria bacterium CG10_big_fil_rev_8_21_14_0_10_42_12 TaxID=1975115 RepID=A0A2H0QVC0_9BACT|nr:MAG: hypothetical protein COV34_01195 [Candidatus Zambryskibacteria bacterium CG10_big_fil_rev_8_21_14_0_10_42_12]